MTMVPVRNLFAACAVLLAAPSLAQQLQLPAPSPAAMVKQTVGLTEITVDYSSPAVKGRKIWGELVPLDKPWRTGANAATKMTFSKDVTFGGKAVPAGTYSIVTLPSAKAWTMVLNKDLGAWKGQLYDAKTEVARVSAPTAAIANRERMTFLFSNTTDNETSLDLEWEKLRISVPIKTDTATHTQANIASALENAWRPHASVARYLAESSKDYDQALKYVDTSLAVESTWFNNWTKAEILAKKGQFGEARKYAQIANELGAKDPNFFFKDAVAKALTDWKNKT
jgi:hypothetical protein